MEEKEREIWVGESRFYLGEDNIIYITEIGEHGKKQAIAKKEVILKLLNLAEGKVDYLIDLNKTGKQSPEARNIYRGLMEHERIGKVAIFGMHSVARVIASFVMGVTKKKDMRFFKTKEDALIWLKE